MPYLKEIKKMQESLRCDGYTQIKIKDMEKITVTREDLVNAIKQMDFSVYIGIDHSVFVDGIFNKLKELPTVEFIGLTRDIKYVAMDKDGDVYFYINKPELDTEFPQYKGPWITSEFIEQSLLNPIKECDWKESLHKVVHQEDDIKVKLSNTIENIKLIDKYLSNIKLSKDYLNSLKNS